MNAVADEPEGVDDYVEWKRQAAATVWLLATEGHRDVGAAIGIAGWHSPSGVGRCEVRVLPDARCRGVGSGLLRDVSRWARNHDCDQLTAPVAEQDGGSLAWAGRRGFSEAGRSSRLVLDLTAVDVVDVDPPVGIEIVTWAGRSGLERGMYAVAREAYPDVPGEEDTVVAPFEKWLANDLQGAGDRPEATFVALAGAAVVGYAKLSFSSAQPTVAWHDLTGVLRSFRGRGIAGALKRAEIAWAKGNGYTRLATNNDEHNAPIRRLNERHGYVLEPGTITVRGSVLEG